MAEHLMIFMPFCSHVYTNKAQGYSIRSISCGFGINQGILKIALSLSFLFLKEKSAFL